MNQTGTGTLFEELSKRLAELDAKEAEKDQIRKGIAGILEELNKTHTGPKADQVHAGPRLSREERLVAYGNAIRTMSNKK